jgi:hypothetical protein|tara:strand:+ start:2462 stop:2683 length:222 start_codon:yes stop_codon:yes gene_type:complete
MKRATVYFEESLHKALKMKSAEISTPVSDLVNDAVRSALLEDAEDLEAFKERENEPVIDFEAFVASLKENGTL